MSISNKWNLTDHPVLKIAFLCLMYVAQGITHGFLFGALVDYLTQRNVSTEQIASVTAAAIMPFAFKWIWGPIIDRFTFLSMGRRRPWLIFAQFMMVVTMAATLMLGDIATQIKPLIWIFFIHNVFKSLQDVSVDALAVDILKEEERGRANGFMFGFSYTGTFIGIGLNYLVTHSTFMSAVWAMLFLLMVISIIPLLIRERAGEKLLPWTAGKCVLEKGKAVVGSTGELFRAFIKAFSIPSAFITAVTALMIYLSNTLLVPLASKITTQKVGFSSDFYTTALILGSIGGMLGSISGGFMADKCGHKRTLIFILVLLSAAWIAYGFLLPYWNNVPFALFTTTITGALTGAMAASFFSIAMDVSWKKIGGSQFACYMALLNVSYTIAIKSATHVENFAINLGNSEFFQNTLGSLSCLSNMELRPYGIMYILMGLWSLVVIIPVIFIDPHQTAKVLGDGLSETEPRQE